MLKLSANVSDTKSHIKRMNLNHRHVKEKNSYCMKMETL